MVTSSSTDRSVMLKVCVSFTRKNVFKMMAKEHSKWLQRKKLVGIQNFEEPSISKEWNYTSVKHLLKIFREIGSMDRRHGSGQPRTISLKGNLDLVEELVCSQEELHHAHLPPRKIVKQTGISQSSIQRKVKKETLSSSSVWKHHKWVKALETDEKPALGHLEKDLKVRSTWSKNPYGKMKKISLLKFLSICRTIVDMVKERMHCDFMVWCSQTFLVNNSK